jgi:hypothetical protein
MDNIRKGDLLGFLPCHGPKAEVELMVGSEHSNRVNWMEPFFSNYI